LPVAVGFPVVVDEDCPVEVEELGTRVVGAGPVVVGSVDEGLELLVVDDEVCELREEGVAVCC
jgi:hypothetical protein